METDKEGRPKIGVGKNGQIVRYSKGKGAFDKGNIPNWCDEHSWFRMINPPRVDPVTVPVLWICPTDLTQ